MIYRLIVLILSYFLFNSCGEFRYSPYELVIDNTNYNAKNLNLILQKSVRESAKTDIFKIVVLSDTHDYYDGLEKQISYINKHRTEYDFVIITGDMSNVGLVEEFEATKKRLKKLTLPFITTVGNHDLLIDGRKIYKRVFGEDTYAFEYKNTKFILYNNNNWESPNNIPNIPWLEDQLIKNTSPNLIVLSHVAPNDKDRYSNDEIEYLKSIINFYNVNYYINGHNHNPGASTFGNAVQLTAGASSKEVILEVKVTNFGVEHAFINL